MENPVVKGWFCDTCRETWYLKDDIEHRKRVVEELYTMIMGKSLIMPASITYDKEVLDMINKLSVKLVGGIPEDFQVYT
jgi:hypothetical protein